MRGPFLQAKDPFLPVGKLFQKSGTEDVLLGIYYHVAP